MQRYLIERPEDVGDSGIYLRDGHYFIYLYVRNILTPHASVDPGAVNIRILDPCGTEVLSSTAMSNITVGEYYRGYNIGSSSVFGEYTVEVSTITHQSKYNFNFYVMPWDGVNSVRDRSGIGEWKDISDENIAKILWGAFEEVRDEVFIKHTNVKPKPDPDTGDWFDGTTTEFRTKHRYIADYDLSGTVSQTTISDGLDCDGDIDGWWLDDNYERHLLSVTVNNAEQGKITITQLGGAPIPRNQNGVYLTYWTEYHTYQETLFKEAVEYYTAHKIAQRFHESDRATLMDIEKNKLIFVTDPKRLEKLYKKALNKIREPACGGVKL